MSKAFTREDDLPDLSALPRQPSPLPPGAKNYLTPGGELKLRAELKNLLEIERPKATGSPNLASIDQRIAYLHQSLESAIVVPVPPLPHDTVHFGATVTVRNRRGDELIYRIVGVDETDLDKDEVSWLSPIAKALLGQRVKFRFPAGEEELEITAITYTA